MIILSSRATSIISIPFFLANYTQIIIPYNVDIYHFIFRQGFIVGIFIIFYIYQT